MYKLGRLCTVRSHLDHKSRQVGICCEFWICENGAH